jgi:Fe-Mn family superoxide dismutase
MRTPLSPTSPAAGARSTALPGTGIPHSGVFELPPLPYGFADLEPVISATTLRIHYGKHHKGYVDALNALLPDSEFAHQSLEDLIFASAHSSEHVQVFHNAAQAWNHTFYWHSLKPRGGGEPDGALQALIRKSFGDFATLQREWTAAAKGQFGSGWAWLALDGGRLKVVKTSNADNVLTDDLVPLLVIDVWEHAYYLDVQNRREEYVGGVLDKLLNWEFAAENLATAVAQRGPAVG